MSKKTNTDAQSAVPQETEKAVKARKSSAKATAPKTVEGAGAASKEKSTTPVSSKPARKTAATAAEAKPAARKAVKKAAPAKAAPAKEAAPPVASKTAQVSKAPAPATVLPPIQEEEIARLAYSYAEARGFQGGSPEADWYRARQELLRLRGQ
ncbi:MAG: DUF2934 domain-containing protein [Bryobacterales bacterium]|nr:DUF2934 domain-containing protein [Bryobacterales bacterium]